MKNPVSTFKYIQSCVGLKEDQKYHELYDEKDPYGKALHFLALRNFKRFIAVLYYLLSKEHKQFDLIIGAGDSGIWLAEVTKMLYQKLNLTVPTILTLPIVRFKFTHIEYEGQPLDLFDNSVLSSQAKKQLENLEKLENILYVDDEIKNGTTAGEAMKVVLNSVNEKKISPNVNVTIVAEDQSFVPKGLLKGVSTTIYPFATQLPSLFCTISYIIPESIDDQIKPYFNLEDVVSKVRVNTLLGLPSKEKELIEGLFIPKPVFTDEYLKKAQKEIPNFNKLQDEFKGLVSKLIDEAIEEYHK